MLGSVPIDKTNVHRKVRFAINAGSQDTRPVNADPCPLKVMFVTSATSQAI